MGSSAVPGETLGRSIWDLVPNQGLNLGHVHWEHGQPLGRQGSPYNLKSIYQWFESPRAQRVDSGKSALRPAPLPTVSQVLPWRP